MRRRFNVAGDNQLHRRLLAQCWARLAAGAMLLSMPAAAVVGTQLETKEIAPQNCAVLGNQGICSATQVGRYTLLSAAHCFNARSPQPPLVNCDNSDFWQPSSGVILHPDFDPVQQPGEPLFNDVALIRFNEPLPTQPAIPVFDRSLFEMILYGGEAACQLSGFGGSRSWDMRQSAIPFNMSFHRLIESTDLLEQEIERIQGGDSGGGLLCDWGGQWYAMAVHETVNRVEVTRFDENQNIVARYKKTLGMSRPLYHYQNWQGMQRLIY